MANVAYLNLFFDIPCIAIGNECWKLSEHRSVRMHLVSGLKSRVNRIWSLVSSVRMTMQRHASELRTGESPT